MREYGSSLRDARARGNEGVTKSEHYIGIPTARDIGILEEQLYSAEDSTRERSPPRPRSLSLSLSLSGLPFALFSHFPMHPSWGARVCGLAKVARRDRQIGG